MSIDGVILTCVKCVSHETILGFLYLSACLDRGVGCPEKGTNWQWEGRLSYYCSQRNQNSTAAESPKHCQLERDCDRQAQCSGFQEGQRFDNLLYSAILFVCFFFCKFMCILAM